MMAETKTCPKCGAELPVNAPSGICPKCLMQAGLESEQHPGSASELNPTTPWSGFVPPQPEDLAKFFPQLEILELLGKGGMGAVYKARQPGLDRFVTVKILPPEIGTDPAFAERFTREARALAKLSHQNIVSVFDIGRADGQYYFIMEYVDGENLRHLTEQGAIKPEEALAIVPQICEALQFAHDEGIVHRDIKPENILIDKQGRVKIADFGLAKLLGEAPAQATLTGTHQAMGTPHYMAPEQMQGAATVDHRADIYSLGVVFYELLTGELPIGRFEPPSKKVRIDVRLDEVVLRSLESAPDRRYQHASDVKTDVESIVGGSVMQLPTAKPATADHVSLVRHQLKIPAIGLLVAGIVNLLAAVSIVLITVLVEGSEGFIEGLEEGFVEGSGTFAEALFRSVIIALFSLVSGIILVLGAARMFDLQSYGIALIAAVVAILPCAVGFPISLPFGIWAMIVVLRHDVKTTFADGDVKSEWEQMMKGTASAVGGTMVIGMVAGLTLGAVLDQDNIGNYMVLGMILGLLIGWGIDANKRRKSKD
jgi:predicted Ser/Thr protein kinase